jgi:hypothetical protein
VVDFGPPMCLWTALSLVPGPDIDRFYFLVMLGNLFFHCSLTTKTERAFTEGIGQVITEIMEEGAERCIEAIRSFKQPTGSENRSQ